MGPHYEEKIGYSRGSLWAPFHAVGMVARIQGEPPIALLQEALRKLQILYPPLASRVRIEQDGAAWLTTEGVEECPIDVRSRHSDDDWLKLFIEQERIPFPLERGPVSRFFLLRGEQHSDLVAIAPHVICDGYAMTQVMMDAVALLNNPGLVVTLPAPPPAVTYQSMSHGAREHLLLRSFIHVFNRLWPKNRARVSQVSYESLHRLYWDRRQSGLLVFELSPAQTAGLAARCRQHGLSITGALVAAFLLGLDGVQHPLSDVTVAVNIRDRMTQPPGRGMGVYASNINMTIRPKAGTDFWDLAHECHTRIHKMLADPSQILWPLAVGELAPTFADSMLAALSSGQLARRLGPLTRFVKIGGMSPSLDVSNIGRVDLPGVEGPYHLETLLPLPPHWPGGGLALNVLTVNNQMNVILKFRLDQVEAAEVSRIRDRAVDYLTGA